MGCVVPERALGSEALVELLGDSFLDAHTGRGPFLDELPTVHQSFGLSERDLHSMSGSRVLHGQKAKGERFKLYPKHERVLRYEATFNGARARTLLGAPIRFDKREHLDEDLSRLARIAYKPLMSVRQDLLDPHDLSPVDVWVAFAKAGRKPDKTRTIFDAFVAGNLFHNPEERYSSELRQLKRMKMVRIVGRGLWAPTGSLRRYLSKLHLVWTHPDNAEPPTGSGTTRSTRPDVLSGARGVSTIEPPQHPRTRSVPSTSTRAPRGVSMPSQVVEHAA